MSERLIDVPDEWRKRVEFIAIGEYLDEDGNTTRFQATYKDRSSGYDFAFTEPTMDDLYERLREALTGRVQE